VYHVNQGLYFRRSSSSEWCFDLKELVTRCPCIYVTCNTYVSQAAHMLTSLFSLLPIDSTMHISAHVHRIMTHTMWLDAADRTTGVI
jgi:hypothetical protein